MRDFYILRRKRIGVHAETVILGGDLHLFGEEILYGMIRTVVAEFELERFSA
jgi:hypothetical protein